MFTYSFENNLVEAAIESDVLCISINGKFAQCSLSTWKTEPYFKLDKEFALTNLRDVAWRLSSVSIDDQEAISHFDSFVATGLDVAA